MHHKSHDRVFIQISNVKLLGGNRNRIALFSAEFPSGTVFHQLCLERAETRDDYTIVPPRIALLNADGSPIKDGAGRTLTESMMSFTNAAARSRFQSSILAALARQAPQAFVASMSPGQFGKVAKVVREQTETHRVVTGHDS